MIKKLKKPKTKPLSYYQKKADRLIQEIGRQVYDKCLVCGGEYSCLHHFVKKSRSLELRYAWINLIPLCTNCHGAIHQGRDDTKTGLIVAIKGNDWLNEVIALQRKGIGKYYGKGYYKNIIDTLPYKI